MSAIDPCGFGAAAEFVREEVGESGRPVYVYRFPGIPAAPHAEVERLLVQLNEAIAALLLDGVDPDEGSPSADALHHLYAAHSTARALATHPKEQDQ